MSTEIKRPIPLSDVSDLRPLGSLELQVIQVVWRREEAGEETTTVKHAFETLHAPDNRIAVPKFVLDHYHHCSKTSCRLIPSQHYRVRQGVIASQAQLPSSNTGAAHGAFVAVQSGSMSGKQSAR